MTTVSNLGRVEFNAPTLSIIIRVTSEKLNIKFVPAEARAGLLTAEEKSRLKKLHEENKHFLRIPRRPHWDESTTPTLLQQTENDSFLQLLMPGILCYSDVLTCSSGKPFHNSSRLLHKDELLDMFKAAHNAPRCKEQQLTIGLGKLLYCHPPPHINPEDFQPQHSKFQKRELDSWDLSAVTNRPQKIKRIENVVDKNFFHQDNVRALTKGVKSIMGYKPGSGPVGPGSSESETMGGKHWKKHGNRNKKEKLRRITKHLDG
ncbi:hypothetical protein GOODEAATRI_002465 [Goodea atripinnis]|uniref:Uncharacterized protein n=1 Tax=Goodea atripinnis TaxID=208336 RepID=A0ABV0MEG5_9TELE